MTCQVFGGTVDFEAVLSRTYAVEASSVGDDVSRVSHERHRPCAGSIVKIQLEDGSVGEKPKSFRNRFTARRMAIAVKANGGIAFCGSDFPQQRQTDFAFR